MRGNRWIALIAALVLVAVAAPGARASAPDVQRADLVGHVYPEIGHRVVAVALRYDRPIHVRAAAPDAFTVEATIGGVTAPRTVTRVYSAAAPTAAPPGRPGRYLILALDPADANAPANGNSADGATAPHDLRGAYTITQADGARGLPPLPTAVENEGLVTPVVDDFARRSFTDSAGTRIAYRFFRPERQRAGRRYPLVLFLHGGGETGSPQVRPANTTQITANRGAIVWATPERQAEDPAFVVAPQLPGRTSQWTEPAIRAAVMGLLARLGDAYPVDPDRIYLTGLSRGGRGAVEYLSQHPDTFAGALLAAARAEDDDVSAVPAFAHVPLWLTHAADDPVVPYAGSVDIAAALEAAGAPVTRGEWAGDNSAGPAQDRAAEAAARRLLARARAGGSHTLFTTYSPGTVAVNAHFSWGPMYETDVMLDWLFAQER
jgi:predicted peptidase